MDQLRNSVHLDNEQNELKDLNTQENELNTNTCNLFNLIIIMTTKEQAGT